MTSPKEDQQPMTTREELVAIADILDRIAPGDGPAAICAGDRRIISNALRLSSRQEVSVEELARLIEGPLLRRSFENRVEGYTLETSIEQARALRAEYSITNRTE